MFTRPRIETITARRAAKQRPDVLNVSGGMHAWLAAGLPNSTCPTSRSTRRPR